MEKLMRYTPVIDQWDKRVMANEDGDIVEVEGDFFKSSDVEDAAPHGEVVAPQPQAGQSCPNRFCAGILIHKGTYLECTGTGKDRFPIAHPPVALPGGGQSPLWLALKDLFDFCMGRGDIGHQGLGLRRVNNIEKVLCEAVLASPTEPKVWTAETIKDAPEGVYKVRKGYGKLEWFEVDRLSSAVHYVCAENPNYPFGGPKPGDYDRAFGPIPQPPKEAEA